MHLNGHSRADRRRLFAALSLFVLTFSAASSRVPAVTPDPVTPGGAYERSLQLARQALALRPQDVGLLSVLAGVHFRWGKFKEAAAAFLDVLRVDRGNVEAMVDVADCYAKLEDDASAVQYYRKAIDSRSPQYASVARRSLADLHFKSGRYSDAIVELQALLAGQESVPELSFLLGRALAAQAMLVHASPGSKVEAAKLDAEASSALERAVQLDASNAQAYYVLSSVHRRQGKTDLAQKDLERFRSVRTKVSALDTTIAEKSELHFEARTAIQLAKVFLATGDPQRAEKLAQHALSLDPTFMEALAYQAWVFYRTQRLDEAIRCYENILAKEPQHAEALWNLGNIHLSQGHTDSGAGLVLRAAQSRKVFPEAWELLARLATENGVLPERAEEFARNSLKQRPSRDNYVTLAVTLFSAGRAKECKEVVVEGLKRYPGDPALEQALQNLNGPR